MRKRWITALAVFFLASVARTEYVNFRDPSSFAVVDGHASYSVAKAGNSFLLQAEPDGALLTWSGQGGVGVKSDYDDYAPLEIGGREVLTVTFPNRVSIQSATLRNLYNVGPYRQTGWYELDKSGNWIPFAAAEDQHLGTDGELTVNLESEAAVLSFAAPGAERRQFHEFSVAGLEVDGQTIPEPASILVFAIAFGSMALRGLASKGRRNVVPA